MRVVVVGSGGREHALAAALGRTAQVVTTPGNAGIAGSVPTPPEELDADLFVVGPEAPLVAGLADRLRAQGKLVFGPGADGARFEGSKTWMKAFFERHRIPSARHASFSELGPALAHLDAMAPGYVVKADSLTAGKGVLVTHDRDEAAADVAAKLSGRSFGDAGRTVVIEEAMEGPELTLLAITDGTTVVPLSPAQDFKSIFDDGAGPNTGGMGAFSPVPVATKAVVDEAMERILVPTVAGLRAEGIDYRGVLYAQMMLTAEGPKMVEYNVRFGDPEAQVVLPRLESDLAALLAEAAAGALRTEPRFTADAAVTVALATEGYPVAPVTGDPIGGVPDAEALEGVTVFHAGTALDGDGRLVTAGGRVLNVTALGPTLAAARDRAYEAITRISFRGMQYRTDIAREAAEQEEQRP